MREEIFGFLGRRLMKQRIIDSLLLFFTMLLWAVVLYSLMYNLLRYGELAAAAMFLLSFPVSFWRTAVIAFDAHKRMKEVNRLNPQMRNLILAAYEESARKGKELTEELERQGIRNLVYYEKGRREFHAKLLLLSLILFFVMLLLFPLHFANAAGLTEKRAVISFSGGNVSLYGENLGLISGKTVAVLDGKISAYRDGGKIPPESRVFYSGPHVKSNEIKAKYFIRESADSIITTVKPHLYQKRRESKESSFVLFAPEYAEVVSYAYFGDERRDVAAIKRLLFDTCISLGRMSAESLNIRVIKDSPPAVRLLLSENEIEDYETVLLPCACIDDYGVEGVGLVVKTEAESLMYRAGNKGDTVAFFEVDLSSLRGNSGYIKAFAKDNNPFRNQTSWSDEIRFDKLKSSIELLSKLDSNEAISGFEEAVERITEEFEERRTELEKERVEETLRRYGENLNEVYEAVKELEAGMKEESRKNLPEQIMKQMYEIKKELSRLDEELLSKITDKMDKLEESKLNREAAKEMLKSDTKAIENALKRLEEMLKQLNKITELGQFGERLKEIEKMQDEEVEGKREQSEVTEEIEGEANKSEESENLKEWSGDLKDAGKISKSAESGEKNGEDVKKKLEEIKKEVEEKMNRMAGGSRYDKNQVMLSLISLNRMIAEKRDAIGVYAAVRDFTQSGEDMSNPLSSMLQRGIIIASDPKTSIEDVKNHNFSIIAFLLKKLPPSGGGMSLDQMLENLSSISEEQKNLSQTLWSMFEEQNTGGEMMGEIARYQREIAEKLRELGKKSGGDGGGLEELSDSLSDIADKIEKGETDEELLKKQERTLNRMLKMTKSLYKQGITEKRESKTGKEYAEPIRTALPEDYGYKKAGLERELKKFLSEYGGKTDEFLIKKYYMEILK